MPYADPEKSFETAVRHLFRHVRDGENLRRNPLVRARFERLVSGGAATALQAAVLAFVDEQAKRLCTDRQYEIVRGIALGEPAHRTADHLKLSRRQYYRDRQTVCAFLGRQMMQPDEGPGQVEICDRLALLFSRATALCDQGFAQKAVTLLDTAWSGISLGQERFAARVNLANALIAFGDVKRAAKLLQGALASSPALESFGATTADKLIISQARLAIATGNDRAARQALQELILRHRSEHRSDDVMLEAAVECGLLDCSNARFSEARESLELARISAKGLSYLSAGSAVSMELLDAYCGEDSSDEFDTSRRRFRNVLQLSAAHGSVRGTIEATIGLMGYHAAIGCEDAMYDLALSALDTARSAEGSRSLLFACAWIGTTFLKTAYWQAAGSLIFEAERLAYPGSLLWVFLKEAQADYLARFARYDQAEQFFGAAQKAATALRNTKWQYIVLRDMGVMLARSGRSDESVQSIRKAIELAQVGAGSWSLVLTQRAASAVLSRKNFNKLGIPATKVPRRSARDTLPVKPLSLLP